MPPPRPTALQSYSRPRIPSSEPRNGVPANTSRKRALSLRTPSSDETPSHRELNLYISRVLGATNLNGATNAKTQALPPLTFRNDIDTQLYGLIAIIVSEFVISWYEPLTPDREFVSEVVGLVAHCSREIEARIRSIDWVCVLGDEVPALIQAHVRNYRQARRYAGASGDDEVRRVYGTIAPHTVLCPVGRPLAMVEPGAQDTERLYRTSLVLAILGIVLPVDDLRNPCLTAMLADVLGDLILGSIIEKFSTGATYWEIIARLGREEEQEAREDRLEKFGLLSSEREELGEVPGGMVQRFTRGFWMVAHVVFTLVTVMWAVMVGLFNARSTDERSEVKSRKPVLKYSLFSMVVSIGQFDRRMPWLTGGFSLLQHYLITGPGRIAASGHVLDNYLRDVVHEQVLDADLVAPVLRMAREAIFPNNKMGPAKPSLTLEEQAELRELAASTILESIPTVVRRRLFRTQGSDAKTGDGDELQIGLDEIKEILDLFSDPMCMKLLLYNILELLIENLFPELKLKGGTTILEEKTGSIDTL